MKSWENEDRLIELGTHVTNLCSFIESNIQNWN